MVAAGDESDLITTIGYSSGCIWIGQLIGAYELSEHHHDMVLYMTSINCESALAFAFITREMKREVVTPLHIKSIIPPFHQRSTKPLE
jgi:hypothetical protein